MSRLSLLLTRLEPDERADADLLAAFLRERDEEAFAELVHRHGPTVWGACRRILHNGADAEDAFQATFLVLVRRGPPSGCLAAWMYRVAVLTARNVRRKNARRQASVGTLSTDVAARSEPASVDVDDLLMQLPERERAAVVLCHLHGLTQREAADRLGVPEGTLSARLSRGLAKLRRQGSLCAIAVPLPKGVAESATTVVVNEVTTSPNVKMLASEVLQMLWMRKMAVAGLALALLCGVGVGVAVSLPNGAAENAGVAAEQPPETDADRQIKEVDAERRKLDMEERALADRRLELEAKAGALRSKLPPELAGPRFEFIVDRKDLGGTIRLEERDAKGRLILRTYFPSFRMDDISSLHQPLRRARFSDGPKVVRVVSDHVPWDGYANSIAAACHDCGFFPKGSYGKSAESIMFLDPGYGKKRESKSSNPNADPLLKR